MHVLVLDDNPDDRELVKREIAAVFPNATFREDGLSWESFEAVFGDGSAYDLVITDYALRWTDGIEVLKRVKALRPELPVIMFTGTGDQETAVEAMKAGLEDYVVKSPRHFARLRASVRAVVGHAQGRAALRAREADLAEALRQKELLLRELHHRVKNNLQTAVALLRLRARGRNEAVRRDLKAVEDRLLALAEVQGRVYAAGDLDAVDMRALVADTARSLVAVYGDNQVALRLDLRRPLSLPVRRATPLALLLYELMLGALTHGFDGQAGEALTVALAPAGPDDAAELVVADNGRGFDPASADDGMGWSLMQQMAAEAGAMLEIGRDASGAGARAVLRLLPEPPRGAVRS
ncbi:MAG TPA: response regulator [Acetobacteraceae bacterium]|nr:response regulator [Acetobacteraceae bacterium]